MRRVICVIMVLALQACVGTPESASPNAATFRRVGAIEFYDFRLNASHDGGRISVAGRDCSTGDYHCYEGLSVLIAPRECRDMTRLMRSRAEWRVSDSVSARFLFQSEDQYYFASDDTGREPRSNGAGGFVYDLERGVIGVWRSDAARGELNRAAAQAIVDSTKWLEYPTTLFACA